MDDNHMCAAGWRKNAISLLPVVLPVPTVSMSGFYIAGFFEKYILNCFRKPGSRCSVSAGNEGEQDGPGLKLIATTSQIPVMIEVNWAQLQKASEGC